MKKIVLLGASGSIGKQTIDIVSQHSDLYQIVGISVGKNINYLREVLRQIPIQNVCVQNKEDYEVIQKEFPSLDVYYGEEGLNQLVELKEADLVFNALLGIAGLVPTINAIKNHKDVAIANKESLVAAGDIVMKLAKENNVAIIPVDSEHSAIFQTINGYNPKDIKRLIITASGGAFKNLTREELENVTLADALKHPQWSMGAKITVDSASMMNKGCEIIEAHVLFNIDYDHIDTIVHPQSIIHSMTEFVDHSVLAQMGVADMRLPIQYALTYPRRIENTSKTLDLIEIGQLNFKKMDTKRFPLVDLAYQCGKMGGNMPAIMNGANETVVEAFLENKCKFLDIEKIDFAVVEAAKEIYKKDVTLEDILVANQWAVNKAKELLRI